MTGTGSFSTSVTWSVSPAAAGTVSNAGVFTPMSAGTATVTATSTEDTAEAGSASLTVNPVAPSGLLYSQTTISAMVGQAITPDTPTVTGTVSSYSVSPALPAGLSLNANTGVISGTPTVAAAQAAYKVTATNSAGSTTATLEIVVAIASPSGLVYPRTTITALVGQAITPDSPTVSGTVSSYSVSPALPKGLSLNANTGVISGTPTVAAAQAAYKVTATNSAGSTAATLEIAVAIAPPSNLVYPLTTITATVGQAITPDTPTVTGTVSSYSVSPALPKGLSLNANTGVISGTPTVAAAQAAYTVTAANSAGSTTATLEIAVAIAPPSNLVYPWTTITALVGSTLTPDTPTVTGTVSSYSVSPALPAGLSLNGATGTISGTAMSLSPEATYTVTAANSAGSTTAELSIVVSPQPPGGLAYADGTIAATAGIAIVQDVPAVTGTVSSYSISPALPAGLSINTSTGVIAGTPTAAAAQMTYTVTATNSGGSATATVTITVLAEPNILLDLGHAQQIVSIYDEGGRVLTADTSLHWVLWDYASGAQLASGDGSQRLISDGLTHTVDMAGQTVVDQIDGALEVRAQSDGHLMATIPNSGDWDWKLASDGSYICAEGLSGLSIYTPAGQLVVTVPGVPGVTGTLYAAPGQIFVVAGNVIDTISATDGTMTVSQPFSGQFYSWFADGSHFLTYESTTVWVYSPAGVQQAAVVLPTITNLGGTGNWFWIETVDSSFLNHPVDIYAIGSNTPTLSVNASVDSRLIANGTTLAVLPPGPATVSIVDLSGSTPLEKDYNVPIADLKAFGASSSSQWIVGNEWGAVFDGASLSGTARYFGRGEAWSIAGAPDSAAISTADGTISVFDPTADTLSETIDFSSSHLAFSANGTVLGASANANDAQYEPDRTLNFYSLPSGNVISTFPYTLQDGVPYLFDYWLAASGTTIGRLSGVFGTNWTYTRTISDISGGTVIYSDNTDEPIFLSPDGTLAAIYPETPSASPSDPMPQVSTTILKNGQVVTAVPGMAIGWIDNDRLLVNNYTTPGSSIYSSSGVLMATLALSLSPGFEPFDSNTIYDPGSNSLYSLSTGRAIWTGTFPSSGVGAVAGASIVYEWGHRIVVETPSTQ